MVSVADVSAAVLTTVLEYIYSDAFQSLAPIFFTEQGAEQLFDAADRYLIFQMKVQIPQLWQILSKAPLCAQ